jgi:hypothetical protein
MTRRTFNDVLTELDYTGVIQVECRGTPGMKICLCDPTTRTTLEDYAADEEEVIGNYRAPDEKGKLKRVNYSVPNAKAALEILTAAVGSAGLTLGADGKQAMIRCPYHQDGTPSCSVNLVGEGFHCFGCEAKGSFYKIIWKLTGTPPAYAKSFNPAAEFVSPATNAEAVYTYKNKKGGPLKRVLRFPGKKFVQESWSKGDWQRYECRPMLYKLEDFHFSDTICILEGEKDADTLNGLTLIARNGSIVIGTTTGGANTWKDEFAAEFEGKRVIIMADNDPAGHRYSGDIKKSLDRRGTLNFVVQSLGDGINDVTEYMEAGHSAESLLERMGPWCLPREQEPEIIDVGQA